MLHPVRVVGPGIEYLFAYGTLCDPEICARVLGATPTWRAATLHDHQLRQADGFYFARPCEGRRVEGRLLALSHEQLTRADAWEEVPLYQRVRVGVVREDGMRIEAWVYVREAEGEPVTTPGIAELSREEVLAILDREP